MKPNIGEPEAARDAVNRILAVLLADEQVLYAKTRNYHWNVVGIHFRTLHAFFEEQYDDLAEKVDEIAERIRKLGGQAPGTLTEYVKTTRLREEPGRTLSARDMIASLLADHEAVIRHLRDDLDTVGEKYHDAGTQDFLTGLMESHEKTAWMLRAHLAE